MAFVRDLSPAARQPVKEGENILGRNLQVFNDLLRGARASSRIQRPDESALHGTQFTEREHAYSSSAWSGEPASSHIRAIASAS